MTNSTAAKLSRDWMGQVSQRMRARRFAQFAQLIDGLPKPVSILDVGGRAAFWADHGWANRSDVYIVTGNIEPQNRTFKNIEPVYLDATDLSQYNDQSIDVVFSNSVIEHLFNWENQVRMASEVCRIARAYWVQTPNYWFPMEPHFRVIGWQWLPEWIRVEVIRRRRCGWLGRTPDRQKAINVVREVQLLSAHKLRKLFPDAALIPERFAGLVKSWTAVGGSWEPAVFGASKTVSTGAGK